MTSWRDSASQQEQDDLDELLNLTLPLAEQMMQGRGEFFPFGASMVSGSEPSVVMAEPALGERPDSEAVIAVLI